jgi:Ohr subfamily peroxiredoxin
MSTPIYTAQVHVTGGRANGRAISSDGELDIHLERPAMIGKDLHGTNPEQLFAAGYAACFMGALTRAFANAELRMPADIAIDSEVSLLPKGDVFTVGVSLKVSMPGIDHDAGEKLLHDAHQICPYSNATRGNIDVELIAV